MTAPREPLPPADLAVDCRGMRCPMPVIVLANRIDDVPVGAVVAVAADDPAAGPDIAAWCRMRRHEHLGSTSAADGVPVFLVRRSA